MIDEIKDELNTKMSKAIDVLSKELSGLRTGRSSPHLLDPVVVEAYGDRLPISQVATVSTPDAVTLSVQVWDISMTKAVEKAIADANLGLNTNASGQVIRINMPPLSEERRKEIVKLAHKYGENTKVALRNIRRDANDAIKKLEKDSGLSEDDVHAEMESVQEIIDSFSKKVEDLVRNKEKDILTI